jgi:malto-oligosyltrehalose trehalohydrolase
MTGEAPLFGPWVEAGRTAFRLWAPDAATVRLLVEGRPAQSMDRDPAGVWRAAAAAPPGALYRFVVDGRPVPDPASRFQPHDVAGPSQVVDEASYAWRNPEWPGRPWEEAVVYEAHLGVLGGYAGLAGRLPALAALGITAIELMPIADFAGTRNWGYDGVLPFAPDSAYGPRDALKALVDDAHGLGLMVLLDVVCNHFGPEGNWLPAYAAAFFDPAIQTPWGSAINFEQPMVRRFFTESVVYWLETFGFDGLRFDAAHAIADRGWLAEAAAAARAACPGRRIHLVLENEANEATLLRQGFDAQWSDDFHNVMHVLLTGETHAYYGDFADHPAERLARALAEGFIYQGEASPHHGGARRGEPSADLPPTAFITFLQNHDQVGNRALGERLTRLARPAALRAAMALMLLCPQIPLLFMGEEVGAAEPFLFFTDFHGELADAVREGRRREFARSPGFGSESAARAIPDPNALSTFEASRWTDAAADAEAWRALVGGLLALRRTHLVPRLKGAASLGAEAVGPAAVLARWRLSDGAVLTLAANFGERPAPAALPSETPLSGGPADGAIPPDATLAWIGR